MATVKMVTTGDLFSGKYKFILPAYQRGYRWRSPENNDSTHTESSQILQLLEDIKEYLTQTKFNEKFYCMQPVVVAEKSDNEYYLVDGQQRLTTFFLLFRFLIFNEIDYLVFRDNAIPGERKPEEVAVRLRECMFSLEFENRDIESWLNNIQNITEIDNSTADKYFLSSAYLCIKNWFAGDSELERKFLELLKRKSDDISVPDGTEIPRSLQFIWYELEGGESSGQEKLFQRLNKGKLPLTSAELIKAFLFGEFERKIQKKQDAVRSKDQVNWKDCQPIKDAEKAKERFEKEWEEYENAMQEESFWYFISKYNYDTRLEYLFELSLKMDGETDPALCSGQNVEIPQHTFYLFKKSYDKRFKDDVEAARTAIFEYYQKLRKYYRDWELYHLIGCLVHLDVPMNDICAVIRDAGLIRDAAELLKKKILRTLFHKNKPGSSVTGITDLAGELGKLDYNAPNQMRKVLLVFNIAVILSMKQKSVRFDFDQYLKGNWDLEHICSQNQRIPDNKQEQWLNTIVDYFLGTAFVPPPAGFESKEDVCKRDVCSRKIFTDWYEKFNPPAEREKNAADFEEFMESIAAEGFQKVLARQLSGHKTGIRELWKNYILYGIYQIKYENRNKNELWEMIFELVNVLERDGEAVPPNPENGLRNITLLDARTNRSYQDAPFFVKRKHIIAVEGEGRYILPGTRNVFLKAYSDSLDNMLFWDPAQDGDAYFNKVKDILAAFFALPAE